MPGSGKGKFSTDIAQDLIDAAVRSVDKAKRLGADGPTDEGEEIPIEEPAEESATEEPATEEVPTAEAGGASGASAEELGELRAQLDLSQAKGREMMEKLKDTHDRMLRAVADLDNYRKRAQKEKEEAQRFGNERLLKDLLPVLDNLDRALEHAAANNADFDSLKQGVAMTRKLFEDALGKSGVKSFTSVGKPFDPNFHEAMQQVERADVPANQVVMEVLRGFTLNERLVRPALVMVSKAPEAKPEPGPKDAGEPGGAE